jgi:hypothetical protein
MIKILELQRIHSKRISLLTMTKDSQAKVVIENNLTERFNVKIGVRQCDVFPAILFNLTMDYTIKK